MPLGWQPELRSPTTGENFARILPSGPRWTGRVEMIESALYASLHWRKPRRIFVNSMSDLFHESLAFKTIALIYAAMPAAPQHTYQILTKRPERRLQFFEWLSEVSRSHAVTIPAGSFTERQALNLMWLSAGGPCAIDSSIEMPAPFIWEGISVENQATAEARIPLLLQTRAAVRFVSYEPALELVDFSAIHSRGLAHGNALTGEGFDGRHLDWVIVGGESGPGARPFDIAWARQTIKQCKAAGVRCFIKQLGANIGASGDTMFGWPINTAPGWSDFTYDPPRIYVTNRKGGDPEEWPEWARVREFPIARA